MKYFRFCVGPLGTNCYMVEDEETKKALVIDPGADCDKIVQAAESKGLTIEKIVLTHAHFDHIMALNELIEATGAELYLHKLEVPYLYDGELNLSKRFADEYLCKYKPTKELEDGDTVSLGTLSLKVMHTPGHTPGSIILIIDGIIFSGDTVFCGCIGRYDFPGGNYQTIMSSVQKIAALEGDYKLLPGHDSSTTLNNERMTNIYFS